MQAGGRQSEWIGDEVCATSAATSWTNNGTSCFPRISPPKILTWGYPAGVCYAEARCGVAACAASHRDLGRQFSAVSVIAEATGRAALKWRVGFLGAF